MVSVPRKDSPEEMKEWEYCELKKVNDNFKCYLRDCGIPDNIVNNMEEDWMFSYNNPMVGTALMRLVTSTPEQKNLYNSLNKGFTQFKDDDAIINIYRTEHNDENYKSIITALFLSGIEIKVQVDKEYENKLITLITMAYADEVLNKI